MDGGVSVINAEPDSAFTDAKSKRIDYYAQLFTFKPSINEASRRMSENSDFLTRQKLFIERQKKHLEEAAGQYRSQPSPVKYTYRTIDNERATKPPMPESERENALAAGVADVQPQPAPQTSRFTSRSKHQSNGTLLRRSRTMPLRVSAENDAVPDDDQDVIQAQPLSKRSPTKGGVKATLAVSNDRVAQAKQQVDEAIKSGKVFTIIGPYPQIRRAMRKKGWVERFSERINQNTRSPRAHSPKRKLGPDDDDGDDDYDDNDGLDELDTEEEKVRPWEEDGGVYGIMSRMLRDVTPSFIWSLCKAQVDFRLLRKEQMVNHFAKTGTFTTKIGLCSSLRELPWYDNSDSDSFYPRAYLITTDDDRQAFVDDYRITACVNILKLVLKQYEEMAAADELDENGDQQPSAQTAEGQTASTVSVTESQPVPQPEPQPESPRPATAKARQQVVTFDANVKQSPRKHGKDEKQAPKLKSAQKTSQPVTIPSRAVETALEQCRRHLRCKKNEDLDDTQDTVLSDSEWDQLLKWSYDLSHKTGVIQCSRALVEECRVVTFDFRAYHMQYEMDGTMNLWICKPGAKSRGRDIKCFDNLKDIIAYTVAGHTGIGTQKETYVVQKYIENPLLIYNTKFDIRQWFLVTDWNPLTVHWYYDCYLRFCSQPFSMDDYDESIHLSNNSIQCKYTNARSRSSKLPEENMWYSWQFDDYLRSLGYGSLWKNQIVPQMKAAVLKTLCCVQDLIETRKGCFEMFGADFMISEDFRVHLIEINSAPCLAPSTAVTEDLVEQVVDDLLKVVLDRRTDRNCDIGKWELICRSPVVAPPPYFGLHLVVEGHEVRKPPELSAQPPTSRAAGTLDGGVRSSVQNELTRRSYSVNNLSMPSPATRLATNNSSSMNLASNSGTLPKMPNGRRNLTQSGEGRLATRPGAMGNAPGKVDGVQQAVAPPSRDALSATGSARVSCINMSSTCLPVRRNALFNHSVVQTNFRKVVNGYGSYWQMTTSAPKGVPYRVQFTPNGGALLSRLVKSAEKALDDTKFREEICKIRSELQNNRAPPQPSVKENEQRPAEEATQLPKPPLPFRTSSFK